MRVMTLMAALAATLVFAQSAHAREYHYRQVAYQRQAISHTAVHRYASRRISPADNGRSLFWGGQDATTQAFAWSTQTAYSGNTGARPRAWCGWHLRQVVGADPGPEYNLARNWAHWGHAGPPGIGAVVVWSHHVGKIVGQENGQWIVESGNDGNRVRTRALPISNAIAIRWG
jgi:hypothetical protein